MKTTDTAKAIRDALISPNEYDSNGETANVVDGLFALARAIRKLTETIQEMNGRISHP